MSGVAKNVYIDENGDEIKIGKTRKVNYSKSRGTFAENLVVKLLKETFWPHAERRALAGNKDKGDTTGHPGLVFEVKARTAISYPGVLRETETERINAGADFGILIHKPPLVGKTRVEQWFALMDSDAFLAMLAKGDSLGVVHEVKVKTNGLDIRAALRKAEEFRLLIHPGMVCSALRVQTSRNLPDYHVVYFRDVLTLLNRAGYGTTVGENGS